MLRDWRRFNREARALIGMNGTAPSLGHWLEQKGFSRHFIERLIVPQASAVWSADPEQMWSFPASFMAEFFDNHGMYSLRGRPALADGQRRLAPLRRGDLGAVARPGPAARAGAADRAAAGPGADRGRMAARARTSTRS